VARFYLNKEKKKDNGETNREGRAIQLPDWPHREEKTDSRPEFFTCEREVWGEKINVALKGSLPTQDPGGVVCLTSNTFFFSLIKSKRKFIISTLNVHKARGRGPKERTSQLE